MAEREPDPTADPRLALTVDLANQFDAMPIGVGAEIYGALSFGEGHAAEIVIGEVGADLRRAEEKFRASATWFCRLDGSDCDRLTGHI